MTRLETFADAAFAFAAAMLAISIDEVPSSYDQLVLALLGAPAFAASLAVILLFWYAHQRWSDRYGLEDLPSVLMTFALIMVVMIYVYPLKIMFQSAFSYLSDGFFPSQFNLESAYQFQVLVSLYSAGFLILCGLISSLYAYAWSQHRALEMSAQERFDTASEALAWMCVASFGLIVIVLMWTLPESQLQFAPFAYCVLGLVGPLIGVVQRRAARRRFGSE